MSSKKLSMSNTTVPPKAPEKERLAVVILPCTDEVCTALDADLYIKKGISNSQLKVKLLNKLIRLLPITSFLNAREQVYFGCSYQQSLNFKDINTILFDVGSKNLDYAYFTGSEVYFLD